MEQNSNLEILLLLIHMKAGDTVSSIQLQWSGELKFVFKP